MEQKLNFKRYSNHDASTKYMHLLNQNKPFTYTGENSDLRDHLYPLLLFYDRDSSNKYENDLNIGLDLYEFLNPEIFSMAKASDDGVWKYISLEIIPELVYLRWKDNKDRFFSNSRRIWLKTIWWYIHLSWQGSRAETRKILTDLSTDEIVQLVERSGSGGYRVDLYREIMKQFAYYRKKDEIFRDIFRAVMKKNTIKIVNIIPEKFSGGIAGYVRSLFDFNNFGGVS